MAFAGCFCSRGKPGTTTWGQLHELQDKHCRNRASTLTPLPGTLSYSLSGACYIRVSLPCLPVTYIPHNLLSSAAWLLTFVGRVHRAGALRTLLKKVTYFTLPRFSPGRKRQYRNTTPKAVSAAFPAWPSRSCSLWTSVLKSPGCAGSLQAFSGAFSLVPGLAELGNLQE